MKDNFSFSKEELEKFHQLGYAGPFTLYEPEEMDKLLRKLRPQLMNFKRSSYGKDVDLSLVTEIPKTANYDRHLDISFLAEHICRNEIVDRVSSILGPNVLCWRTEFFPKYPGDEGTDWHQVKRFSHASGENRPQIEWPEESPDFGAITVWTAFTEATTDNGCMQIMPGTHVVQFFDESKKMQYKPEKKNIVVKSGVKRGIYGYDFRELQIDPDWKPDESQAISLVMKPGQFFIFWSTLLHGSLPHNGKTKKMRLGYAARYVPSYVNIYPYQDTLDEHGAVVSLEDYRAVLVSGECNNKKNKVIPCGKLII